MKARAQDWGANDDTVNGYLEDTKRDPRVYESALNLPK